METNQFTPTTKISKPKTPIINHLAPGFIFQRQYAAIIDATPATKSKNSMNMNVNDKNNEGS